MGPGSETAYEPDFDLCSARLQAGMRLTLKCPPEGGRYKNLPKPSPRKGQQFPSFHRLVVELFLIP
jgi:hypothetical protein